MDSADSAVKSIFLKLTSPEVLAEVIVIVIAAVIALAVAHVVRLWHLRRKPALATEAWQNHALDGALAVAPMLLVVVLLLLAHAAFSMLSVQTQAIDTVLQLATAFVLVRMSVYLLGVLVGRIPGSAAGRTASRGDLRSRSALSSSAGSRRHSACSTASISCRGRRPSRCGSC